MKSLTLGQARLTLENVREVAVERRKVALSPQAIERIERSHAYLQAEIAKGGTLYGVNTGFGLLASVRIPDKDIEKLQYNLLRSHACGVGEYLNDEQVRAMMLLRAAALSLGNSGVSLKLVQQILAVLNSGICPLIPSQGSVGASGDLAPLAHLALVLIGEGKARVSRTGQIVSGRQGLRLIGLKPLKLGPKEGLALTNGTQFMSALGTLTLLEAEHLADVADAAGAISVEAMRGTETAFESEIHAVRPHPGQVKVAARMRRLLLEGGRKSPIALSHEGCGKVQDPYSLRCIPQVHGASRDVLTFVREVLEREINSVTDNPLIFPEQKKILSGGNFHGQILSIAMDALSISMAELASISEQRIDKLVNPVISELPAFLAKDGGLNSGMMIVQYAAASIVSENKTLCHPASVDSIPTSADKEDHVSMGAWAAVKAGRVLVNSRRVLAMELLAASQGIEFLRPLKTSPVLEKVIREIRTKVPRADVDRSHHDDLKFIEGLIASRRLAPWVKDSEDRAGKGSKARASKAKK